MSKDFFPPRPASKPTIYVYEDTNSQYAGLLKVGYTTKDVRERVAQQYPTVRPGKPPYRILLEESAMRNDGTSFTDRDVHRWLRQQGVSNPEGEWFACPMSKVKAAVIAVRSGQLNEENRTLDFVMRPEQAEAAEKTAAYFKRAMKEDPDKTPHFLWNAKMRFGKTFAAYQLAKKMGWRNGARNVSLNPAENTGSGRSGFLSIPDSPGRMPGFHLAAGGEPSFLG